MSLLTTCSNDPKFGQIDQAEVVNSFSSIQTQILIPKCGSCHSSQQPTAGFSVSSYFEVMTAPGAVTPYSPASSAMFTDTLSGYMPYQLSALSPTEVQSIYQWIIYGAHND